jgi:hypothetical protein
MVQSRSKQQFPSRKLKRENMSVVKRHQDQKTKKPENSKWVKVLCPTRRIMARVLN